MITNNTRFPRDADAFPARLYQRGFRVFLAIVLAAAVTGFFAGLRHTPTRGADAQRTYRAPAPAAAPLAAEASAPSAADSAPSESSSAPSATGSAPRAVGYSETPANLSPNRDFRVTLETLPPPEKITSRKKFPHYTDEEKLEALAQRAERRAFDGAPPVVPHPITQLGNESCLRCHGEGTVIGDRPAPKISHEHLGNCTQCHVEGAGGPPTLATPLESLAGALAANLAENTFCGLEAVLHGERAHPRAPPAMPHTTWMRTDCLSCHGPSGHPPLQTRHPYRKDCTKCHTPPE